LNVAARVALARLLKVVGDRNQYSWRGRTQSINLRLRRSAQRGVHHDSDRVAPALEPAGQPRIVLQYGAGADHHGVAFVAPSMAQLARGLRTDPAGAGLGRRDPSVER